MLHELSESILSLDFEEKPNYDMLKDKFKKMSEASDKSAQNDDLQIDVQQLNQMDMHVQVGYNSSNME